MGAKNKMKKIMLIVLIALLSLSVVSAEQDFSSLDKECQAYGYDFGISKWEWNGQDLIEVATLSEYSIQALGNNNQVSWTASPGVAGVLSDEVCYYQVLLGGTEGIINDKYDDGFSIQHVTFCGDFEDEEIPEFGTIAAGLALIGAIAGFVIMRERK